MNNAMYPIDRIIVMSLERTPKRWRRWEGAAAVMNIDPSIVSIAFGKDNKDYNDNMKRVAEAAIEDGFPFVEEYAKGTVENGIQQTAATVCQIWNYVRILREIIKTKETALIIFDDKMLTIDFHEFCQMVDEVRNVKDETFYALQMKLRGGIDDIKLPEIDLHQRIKTSSQIFSGVFGKGTGNYIDVFLQKGISGYDESIVWSPEGAKWMLDCLNLAPGFYRYLDHFICKALPEFAQNAILRNKGVYCPSEIAYKFVDEYMEMGTTTDFATKDSPAYERSRRSVETHYFWGEPKTKDDVPESVKLKNKLNKILEE